MTEKRFKEQNLENHLNRIYDTTKGGVVFDEDIVDLLNELHEENQTLKNKYEKLRRTGASLGVENDGLISENYELQKENDELKKEITSLKVELDTHKHPLWSTRESERIVNELKQENEKLKQQLTHCRKLLNDDLDIALEFIKHKGYSLQDLKDYEKAMQND